MFNQIALKCALLLMFLSSAHALTVKTCQLALTSEWTAQEHLITQGAFSHTVLVERQIQLTDETKTHVYHLEKRSGRHPEPSSAKGKAWLDQFVVSIVDFANKKFEQRRTWPAGFRKKLIKTAKKYLFQSRYAVVRDLEGGLLGTIRLIRSPKLPVERYLGKTFVNTDIEKENKFEIGTFAIDETLPTELRTLIWFELWNTVMQSAFDENEDVHFEKAFYTYADPASLRLYEPLGFVRAEDEPIEKDGIEWVPLVFYPEMMITFYRKSFKEEGRFASVPITAQAQRYENGFHRFFDIDFLIRELFSENKSRAIKAQGILYQLLRQRDLFVKRLKNADPSRDSVSIADNINRAAKLTRLEERIATLLDYRFKQASTDERRRLFQTASPVISKLLSEKSGAIVGMMKLVTDAIVDPDLEVAEEAIRFLASHFTPYSLAAKRHFYMYFDIITYDMAVLSGKNKFTAWADLNDQFKQFRKKGLQELEQIVSPQEEIRSLISHMRTVFDSKGTEGVTELATLFSETSIQEFGWAFINLLIQIAELPFDP